MPWIAVKRRFLLINPALASLTAAQIQGGYMSTSSIDIKIDGMTCTGCTGRVTRILQAVAGVESADVTLNPGAAHIVFDITQTNRAALETTVEEAGYAIKH